MLPLILLVVCLTGLNADPTLNDCPAAVPRDEYLKLHDGNCFEFVLDYPVDYETADQDCRVHGGTLAIVKSQNTTDFIIDQLVYVYGDASKIWIGLSDKVSEGTYVWADGTPLDSYRNWGTTNHTSNQLHDCVTFDPSQHGQWAEDFCSNTIFGLFLHENSYVCEYKTRST